jgi:hypothetical protein
MARFDKYESATGGFRAALAAAYTGSPNPIAVGLDVNGRVVPGAGQTGICGVICQPKNRAAGERIDVMVDGEIVECTGLAAGTLYYANLSTGVLQTGATIAAVGFTVEADRLHVRTERV